MIGKPGRHAPAFVLLMIAEKPCYGLEIYNQLSERLPHSLLDTAAVYKALSKLEENNCITFQWDTTASGPPKKMYTLTQCGRDALEQFYEDISLRHQNLAFFMKTFQDIERSEKHE
jgi:DNA-binding PadR family transcriptional regulator